jgi:hypothetical protein
MDEPLPGFAAAQQEKLCCGAAGQFESITRAFQRSFAPTWVDRALFA